MLKTIKKKIIITYELQSKISWACSFCNINPEIIEGNLRIVEKTNLAYVEPHRVIIKGKLYLFFNDIDYFYIGDLLHKYPLTKLRDYIVDNWCFYGFLFAHLKNNRNKSREMMTK